MLKQLKAQNANVEHYVDLVDNYLKLWDIEKKLLADIKKRGITYKDKSSVGVDIWKNNPSIKEAMAVNRQMLQILRELNLTTENAGGDDESVL